MVLELYNREKQFVCALTNDNALLGSFPVEDGMRIHVFMLSKFHLKCAMPIICLFNLFSGQ